MKLLPILLLTITLSVGIACSSGSPVPPPPVPDAGLLSTAVVVGLVQVMLRAHPEEYCNRVAQSGMHATYKGNGVWEVRGVLSNSLVTQKPTHFWHVYEGSRTIKTVDGSC